MFKTAAIPCLALLAMLCAPALLAQDTCESCGKKSGKTKAEEARPSRVKLMEIKNGESRVLTGDGQEIRIQRLADRGITSKEGKLFITEPGATVELETVTTDTQELHADISRLEARLKKLVGMGIELPALKRLLQPGELKITRGGPAHLQDIPVQLKGLAEAQGTFLTPHLLRLQERPSADASSSACPCPCCKSCCGDGQAKVSAKKIEIFVDGKKVWSNQGPSRSAASSFGRVLRQQMKQARPQIRAPRPPKPPKAPRARRLHPAPKEGKAPIRREGTMFFGSGKKSEKAESAPKEKKGKDNLDQRLKRLETSIRRLHNQLNQMKKEQKDQKKIL